MDPLAHFGAWPLDRNDRDYLAFHRYRYEFLLREVAEAVGQLGVTEPRILDVSPLFQTELLRAAFPGGTVNSLGYAQSDTGWGPGREGTTHWWFDLNDCDRDEAWPQVPEHDVLVVGEVLEHLHVAPEIVLRRLTLALREHGQIIIQTPNAAALPKRITLMRGRNPYQRLQPLRSNPGHIREYTRSELADIAGATGFVVEAVKMRNYFEPNSRKYRCYNRAAKLMPPTWRDGITTRIRKVGDS